MILRLTIPTLFLVDRAIRTFLLQDTYPLPEKGAFASVTPKFPDACTYNGCEGSSEVLGGITVGVGEEVRGEYGAMCAI